jgi:hypothetical protein
MTKLSLADLENGMAQWIGTTSYTRHSLMRNLLMTEGVMWLQENAECHWLVDAIASHIVTNRRLRGEKFQTWDFKRHDDDMAPKGHPHMLSVTDGNDGPPIVKQEIEYTDFPLPSIRFFVAHDEGLGGWVIMLPSEY